MSEQTGTAWPDRLVVLFTGAMLVVPCLLPAGSDPVPSFEAEWVAVALGLAAFLAMAARAGAGRLAVPSVAILPIAIAAIVVVQIVAGTVAQVQMAWLACLYLIWAALLACLGAHLRGLARAEDAVAGLAAAVLVGALLNALVAGVQAFGWAPRWAPWVLPVTDGRPGGNLGQPNHLASQLVLGVVSLAYLRACRGLGRLPVAISAVLLAAALSWTGSRTAWLLMAALLAGAWFLGRRPGVEYGRRVRRTLWLVAGLLVAFELAALAGRLPGVGDGTTERMVAAARTGEERLAIWEGALEAFGRAPLFGSGQGTFAATFFDTVPDLPEPRPQVMTGHAHNLVLQVAVEFGVAGLVVFAVFAWLWLRSVRRRRMTPEALWAIGVAWVVIVHSLVEYPLWYAYFLAPCALALGVAEGPRLEFRASRAAGLGWGGGAFVGLVVLATLALDMTFLRSFHERVARAAGPSQAAAIQHLDDMRHFSLLAGYAAVGLQRGLDLGREHLTTKLDFSSTVVRAFPLPDVTYRHALLLAASGDADGARRWWARAVANYPAQAPVWREVARRSAVVSPEPEGGVSPPNGDNS